MRPVIFTFVLILFSSTISAQKLSSNNFNLNEIDQSSEPSVGLKYKSESKAFYLSLLATTVPTTAGIIALVLDKEKTIYRYDNQGNVIGSDIEYPSHALGSILISFGLIYGPSAGHFYSDRPFRALGGMGIRTGSVLIFSFASFATCGWDCDSRDGSRYDTAMALFITGLSISAFSVVYDIFTAKKSARMYNEKKKKTIISFVPNIDYKNKIIGGQLSIRF